MATSSKGEAPPRSDDSEIKSPARKKLKLTRPKAERANEGVGKKAEELLRSFRMKELLSVNTLTKSIRVKGRCRGDDASKPAVLLLEKLPLSVPSVPRMLSKRSKVTTILDNDVFKTFHILPPPSTESVVKSTLIYPATEDHCQKHKSSSKVMITETAEQYHMLTVPYLKSVSSDLEWIYNILDKKSESERILFEDPHSENGFILVPDMKWDGTHVENLHLVAFVNDRALQSIRDLNQQHLELLNNIRTNGSAVIAKEYGLAKNQIRIFFHYQPSFYHLHVHFTHIHFDAPGMDAGRAHLLNDVIENIQLCSDSYQRKTLTFYLERTCDLAKRFGNYNQGKSMLPA